jgi:small-conductance mechanosensitive channel
MIFEGIEMLVFIVIGLFLILMTLYTYFYVSANISALILVLLIIYVPYFILKTFQNVDFKSQIAELMAGKKLFRDFLRKSNFYGMMNTLYQAAPKLLKMI